MISQCIGHLTPPLESESGDTDGAAVLQQTYQVQHG